MVTSRTGTSTWKKVRAQALRLAQAQEQMACPYCGVQLDYTRGLQHNSAEVDHIIPHSRGGTNTLENTAICCRRCNQSKGNGPAPRAKTIRANRTTTGSRNW